MENGNQDKEIKQGEVKAGDIDSTMSSSPVIPVDELDFTQRTEDETGEAVQPIRNYTHAKSVLEALLFTTTDPLSIKKISSIMNDLPAKTIRALILDLQLEYDNQGRGIQVVEIAGGYQMATRQFAADWVYALHKNKKRSPLSPATLETLAIIAYKQPITRAEIESVRGVDSGGILRNLSDQNMIKVVGKKDVIGRPPQYGTTEVFLKVFGLKRLSDLPSISELKEMFKHHADVQKDAPKSAENKNEGQKPEITSEPQKESPKEE